MPSRSRHFLHRRATFCHFLPASTRVDRKLNRRAHKRTCRNYYGSTYNVLPPTLISWNLENAGLAIFWKTIIANPVSVSRAGYILANIFENIASFVSFLDSRDIFIGEFKKNISPISSFVAVRHVIVDRRTFRTIAKSVSVAFSHY